MTKRSLTTAIAVVIAATLTALSALACQSPPPAQPTPTPAAATPAPEAPAASCPPTCPASVTGTVSYPGSAPLPPGAELTVRLEYVSRADAPSVTIAERVIANPGQSPIPFEIGYDPADIDARFDYSIQATITHGGALLFINDTVYSVLTRGHPNGVDMVLVNVRR